MLRSNEVPYKSLAKYPGMRPKDVAIWDQFIIDYPHAFERVMYNVHLGDPVRVGDDKEDMVKSGMFDVSRWCIDVLADDGTHLWAIEIKPDAAASAIGQALAYAALVTQEFGLPTKVLPLVITDEIAPITQQAANLLGVRIKSPIPKSR